MPHCRARPRSFPAPFRLVTASVVLPFTGKQVYVSPVADVEHVAYNARSAALGCALASLSTFSSWPLVAAVLVDCRPRNNAAAGSPVVRTPPAYTKSLVHAVGHGEEGDAPRWGRAQWRKKARYSSGGQGKDTKGLGGEDDLVARQSMGYDAWSTGVRCLPGNCDAKARGPLVYIRGRHQRLQASRLTTSMGHRFSAANESTEHQAVASMNLP